MVKFHEAEVRKFRNVFVRESARQRENHLT